MGAQWARGMLHPSRIDSPVFEAILAMIERSSPERFEAQIRALLNRSEAGPLLPTIACDTSSPGASARPDLTGDARRKPQPWPGCGADLPRHRLPKAGMRAPQRSCPALACPGPRRGHANPPFSLAADALQGRSKGAATATGRDCSPGNPTKHCPDRAWHRATCGVPFQGVSWHLAACSVPGLPIAPVTRKAGWRAHSA